MAQPMKLQFTQDVTETSLVKKEILGALRILADGRAFRYARAGSGGVLAGTLLMAPKSAAGFTDHAATATKTGDRVLSLTLGADVTENAFEDGYLLVCEGPGAGVQRRILANAAAPAGADVIVTLAEPLGVELSASSLITLVPSPWAGLSASGQEENVPAGVASCDAGEGRYLWVQTGGPCLCLSSDAAAVGTMMVPGATAGSLAAMNATLDVDQPVAAVALAVAGSAGRRRPFFLKID